MALPRITATQVRSAFLALEECRELGDDLHQWRSHLWSKLAKLLDADLILHAAVDATNQVLSMEFGGAWGFEGGFNLRNWLAIVDEYGITLQSDLTSQLLNRIRNGETGCTATRQSVIPDREWQESFDKTVIADSIGTSAVIHSFHTMQDHRGRLDSIVITRGKGRKEFTEREAALARFIHQHLSAEIGRSLAGYSEPQPSLLPSRVKQVLACMLQGDSDKQIAVRLNISPYTVNQYCKRIYRHFSVSGRTQLLARWIKRGWKSNSNSWELPASVVQF